MNRKNDLKRSNSRPSKIPLTLQSRKLEKAYSLSSSEDKIEEHILNIGIEEYKDVFPNIMIYPETEFMSILEKFIKFALFQRNMVAQSGVILKTLETIKKKYYNPDYAKVNKIIRSIGDIRKFERYNSSNFLPHCKQTKEPLHSCGEKFYFFSPYYICLTCRLIYEPSCILFYCKPCDLDYYSSINSGNEIEKYQIATWAQYHCKVLINDTMKCFKCHDVLYINILNDKVFCQTCRQEFDSMTLKWVCMICQKEFSSEAKVYNPLDFKLMKITIKQTLSDCIIAKPDYVPCCKLTEEEINNSTFIHKNQCTGILYKGILNNKRIVVCSKCHLLYSFENHLWYCPKCKRRFKLDKREPNDGNYNNRFSMRYELTPQPVKEKEVKQEEPFHIEDYRQIKTIGKGSFGVIYEVEDKKKNKFAMKKIIINTNEEMEALKKEYQLLQSLSKLKINLVTIYGMVSKKLDKTTNCMYILMDLALKDWRTEIELKMGRKQFYSERELILILKSLSQTFAELQRHNISHRDIKPENILIFEDRSFKIADFGEAKKVFQKNQNPISQTVRGTELYMSPILFNALQEKSKMYTEHNTYKSDVFSLGLCFILAASLTYKSLVDIREINDMISIKSVLGKYLKGRYSNKLIDVIYLMIEINEEFRLDFIELEKYVENL